MTAPQFHQLKVSEVTHLTDDSVAVTFEIPDDLDTKFDFIPGQHVTVRAVLDDVDTRRSYSICCPPGKAQIQVGIRRIPDGAFSTFATTQLSPGDVLDVMPPGGDFFLRQLPAPSHLVAIAAGSGITPVLSILTTALADPSAEATLVYGNRTSSSIMFLEELEGLKDKHPTRFNLIHVLSREPQSVELFTGRIDQGKLERLLSTLIDPGSVSDWYLCGPSGMVADARLTLAQAGVSAESVHFELFFEGDTPPPPVISEADAQAGSVSVGFRLDGRRSTVGMEPDQTLLEAAIRVRSDMPFACKGGMCATCKAQLVEGEVAMDRNFALVAEELAAGLILTCQSHPTTSTIEIDYDI